MKQKIQDYLKQLEKDKKIKILLACETGSRAWGFPSPDSDYDVRLIYKHSTDWYLTLTDKKDSIELMLADNEIDITGWDVRKSLRLLRKSNAALLERIQSPYIYYGDEAFRQELNQIAPSCYSRIATLHHYLNLARRFYGDISEGKDYKLKSFFYALRSAVACCWIAARVEIPPIEFSKMLAGLSIDEKLIQRIAELIKLKATKSESYRHQGETELFDFIKANIQQAEQVSKSLPGAKFSSEELDTFFKKTILDK